MIRFFIIYFLVSIPVGFAVPEIARYGHNSCTSCHVSPSGSGVLTDYGRMFSGEKLSTWFVPGEENLLHGAVPSSERLLVGGDLRWVYDRYEGGGRSEEVFWRMQSDVDFVFHVGDAWFQAAFGTKPAGPRDDMKKHGRLLSRSYAVRYDLFDERLIVRGGLFMPKYGLMMADHTTYTRLSAALTPEDEQTQFEITYQDDDFEVSAAILFDREVSTMNERPKKGFNVGIAKMLGTRNRATLGLLKTEQVSDTNNRSVTSIMMSVVLTFTNKLYSMLELNRSNDQVMAEGKKIISDSAALFYSLNYEVLRGLSPFVRYELWNTQLTASGRKITRLGPGFNWYPRPHLQAELRHLITMSESSDSKSTNSTELILHYYF